jgi:recombination protein RecT
VPEEGTLMADTTKTRTALARRQASAPATTNGDTKAIGATVRKVIDRQAAELALVLPSTMDPDRFARLVVSAVKSTPKLMLAFGSKQGEQSILLAAMEAATIGLEPNTPTQQAWIVPRKDHGVWEGRLWIGYRGLLTLVRRSGTVKELVAGVVRAADEFAWSRELDRDTLTHRPAETNRGPATHVYAIARLLNGGVQFSVLTREEVEARRDLSDGWRDQKSRPYSPWTRWPDAMWMKSGVRSLVPWLDLSPDAARDVGQAMSVDERRLMLDDDLTIVADDDGLDDETRALDAGDDDDDDLDDAVDPTSGVRLSEPAGDDDDPGERPEDPDHGGDDGGPTAP